VWVLGVGLAACLLVVLLAGGLWILSASSRVPPPAPEPGDPPGEPVVLTYLEEPTLDPKLLAEELAAAGEQGKIKLEGADEVKLLATTDDADLSKLLMIPTGGTEGGGSLDTISSVDRALGSTMTFMGIQARGQRFCIIADRSGSMSGHKMEYVKAEMFKQLGELKGSGQFFVIFFDDVADVMPGGAWLQGRKQVAKIEPWIRSIYGRGGTDPGPAFEVAMRLNPRPDVIYFMTDGLFSPHIPAYVAQLNTPDKKGKRVVVHTIAFVDREGEQVLQKIAAQSGGKYRYEPGFAP
jgi:hypothetical protein